MREIRVGFFLILSVVAGCGSPVEPPAFGVVSLLIADAQGPVEGVEVAWNDADGALLGTTRTDSDGLTDFDVHEGSSFTYRMPTGALASVLDVEVGFYDLSPRLFYEGTGSLSAQIVDPDPNAILYFGDTGCTSAALASIATTFHISDLCTTSVDTYQFLTQALGASGELVAYHLLVEQPIGPASQILAPWRYDFRSVDIAVSSLDDSVIEAGLIEAMVELDGIYLRAQGTQLTADVASDSVAFTTEMPRLDHGFRAGIGVRTSLGSSYVVIADEEVVPASMSVDATTLLPSLDSVVIADGEFGDLPLVGANGRIVLLQQGPDQWRLVSREAVTGFVFPQLPEEFSAPDPDAAEPSVVLVEEVAPVDLAHLLLVGPNLVPGAKVSAFNAEVRLPRTP